MSAGFRYSHRDIINLDIRHIYSGDVTPTTYRIKPPVFHEGIDYLERIRELASRQRSKTLPGKLFEYNRKYDIILPSVPALRRFSKSEVERVVYRLTARKEKKHFDRKNKNARVETAPPDVARNEKLETSRTPSKKQLSQKDINAMVNRLFHSRTHSAELRQREKVVMKPVAKTLVSKTGDKAGKQKGKLTQTVSEPEKFDSEKTEKNMRTNKL